MSQLEFQPAAEVSLEVLADLFTRCYAGYFVPLTVDATAMSRMISAFDLDLAHSRVGLRDGAPVALAMLGVREARGWIGGMGVVAEARGRGAGRAAMAAILEEARRAGLERVDLNTHAIPMYLELGFRDTRVLEVWARAAGSVPASTVVPAMPAAESVTLAEALAVHAALHSARPPWQRDVRSLRALAGSARALGIRDGQGLAACAIFRPDPARVLILDVGIRPAAPAWAIDALLATLVAGHPDEALTFVNLPADDPAAPKLAALGFRVSMRQREMALALSTDGARLGTIPR